MTEQLLHHIWKFRLFNHQNLLTADGQAIEIISPGMHNTDSGPDFFNARVKIGNTEWAGNIEIHIDESDWNKHNHHNDEAYSNIILHVVYECDRKNSNEKIPVLELKNQITDSVLKQYDVLMLNQGKIPCAGSIANVDAFTINNWLDRMLIERLENKTENIDSILKLNNNNWEEAFYIQLARNFGFKVNAVPFELLARSLPLLHLAKHKSNLFQIEALLFGQAGFLFAKFRDAYPNQLKTEYEFLQKKFSLQPVETKLWKFMRMRPVNFPTIRIAQFAQLIYKSTHLFSKLIEIKNINQANALFDVAVSDYWKTHYVFDKETEASDKHIGSASVENILINTAVPFLFHYGKMKGEQRLQNRAVELLEKIKAENNHIINKWHALNIKTENAAHTQALIQLFNFYCTQKKCLLCALGNKILR